MVAFFGIVFGAGRVIPQWVLPGGVYYLTPLIILFTVAVVLRVRQSAAAASYLAVSGVFLSAIAARELDGPLCGVVPFGTHFLWHLLAALLAYILIRAAILHTPPRPNQAVTPAT